MRRSRKDGEDGANGEEQVDQTSNNESGTKKAWMCACMLRARKKMARSQKIHYRTSPFSMLFSPDLPAIPSP